MQNEHKISPTSGNFPDAQLSRAERPLDLNASFHTLEVSFDAFAQTTGTRSHNAGAGLADSNLPYVFWRNNTDSGATWEFVVQEPSGPMVDTIAGGHDEQVNLSIVVDRQRLEVFGKYRFGTTDGETRRFPVSSEMIASFDRVFVQQDFSNPSQFTGAEIGDIEVQTIQLGLLDSVSASDFLSEAVRTTQAPADTIGLIARLDTSALNLDEHLSGYDLVVLANTGAIEMRNPRIGLNQDPQVLRHDALGESANSESPILDRLASHELYFMLIDQDASEFTFAATMDDQITDDQTLLFQRANLTNGQVAYLTPPSEVTSTPVNQRFEPGSDPALADKDKQEFGDRPWQRIGTINVSLNEADGTYEIRDEGETLISNTNDLAVWLTGGAGGNLAADAVRLERAVLPYLKTLDLRGNPLDNAAHEYVIGDHGPDSEGGKAAPNPHGLRTLRPRTVESGAIDYAPLVDVENSLLVEGVLFDETNESPRWQTRDDGAPAWQTIVGPASLPLGGMSFVDVAVSDPDGDEVHVKATASSDDVLVNVSTGGLLGSSFVISAADGSGDHEVGSDTNGNYVVVRHATDRILAQRFHKDGTLNGTEILVFQHNTRTIHHPQVAMNDVGSIAISWVTSEGADRRAHLQRIEKQGNLVGLPVEVTTNISSIGSALVTDIDINNNEQVALAWEEAGNDVIFAIYDADNTSICQPRRFDATAGVGLGAHRTARIGIDEQGHFVVATTRNVGQLVNARAYSIDDCNRDGKVTSLQTLPGNFPTIKHQLESIDVAADGTFVATWARGESGFDVGLYMRRFQVSGVDEITSIDETEYKLDDTDTDVEVGFHSHVALDIGGKAVVLWEQVDDGSPKVYAQLFGDDHPMGNVLTFDVGAPGAHGETNVRVANLSQGHFLGIWNNADQASLVGQRYSFDVRRPRDSTE